MARRNLLEEIIQFSGHFMFGGYREPSATGASLAGLTLSTQTNVGGTMKTLFAFATGMVVLFLVAPNKLQAQTPDRVSRLEARVAQLEKRLAELESKLASSAGTTSDATRTQPGSNRKLLQENAEKAIKGFASTNSVSPILGTLGKGDCSFNVQSIALIQPLDQFTETEATTNVALKCTQGYLGFKFVFQKDIDNRWFLTKIGEIKGVNYTQGQVDSMITGNQNLKVRAQ